MGLQRAHKPWINNLARDILTNTHKWSHRQRAPSQTTVQLLNNTVFNLAFSEQCSRELWIRKKKTWFLIYGLINPHPLLSPMPDSISYPLRLKDSSHNKTHNVGQRWYIIVGVVRGVRGCSGCVSDRYKGVSAARRGQLWCKNLNRQRKSEVWGGGGQGRPFLQTSSAQLPPKGDAERTEHQMELCI